MNEIFNELETKYSFDKLELESKIRDKVWAKYEQLRKEGFFEIRIFKVIKVDISGKISELLTKWFGENPYRQEG